MPPLPCSIAAVAFDLDGLMVNSEDVYEHVGAELLRRRGGVFTDALRLEMMGRPARAALGLMLERCGLTEDLEALVLESEQLFWELAEGGLRPMPGLEGLLAAVDASGLPRSVVTSGARQYATRMLKLIGRADGFAFLVTGDDITHGKPHPEPYLLAAARHGVAPGSMLALEDTGLGCQSAVAAGAVAVAVPTHHTAHNTFQGVALVADSLADPRLLDLITGAASGAGAVG